MTDVSAIDRATIPEIVEALRTSFRSGVLRSLDSRRTQLRQLQRMLTEQEDAILRAMADDLGKPPMEAYAAEIGLVLGEIKATLKQLDAWCAPERVKVQLAFKPGAAEVIPEPLVHSGQRSGIAREVDRHRVDERQIRDVGVRDNVGVPA